MVSGFVSYTAGPEGGKEAVRVGRANQELVAGRRRHGDDPGSVGDDQQRAAAPMGTEPAGKSEVGARPEGVEVFEGNVLQSPPMNRRTFLHCGLAAAWGAQVNSVIEPHDKLDVAADVLTRAVAAGQVAAAVLYVRHGNGVFARPFGTAKSVDELFLLGSISKTMTAAALLTLYDQGSFQIDDPVRKFLPEFTGAGRDRITVRQLLTHVSGLPDQLPENQSLRKRHAPLADFVAGAIRTPLGFEPGSRYEYSSMALLLAAEIAQRISGSAFLTFIEDAVFRPLEMKHSALGLGRFPLEAMMRCQAENAAPESGAGDPTARDWDWNSPYWRGLGSPWGGVHASAPDVARFLAEFLNRQGKAVRPETAQLMRRNHNPSRLTPRGLGFAIGSGAGSPGCSEATFGHGGSTGTLAWADPRTETICVVLTTLPGGGGHPHPRTLVSDRVAEAVS
jgi:CubicO group peptidase (beta-lactamase class C family)